MTGYESKCIFARLDRASFQNQRRASHWGVDICPDISGKLPISFYTCERIKIKNICSTDKNIFHRYTTDILWYYEEAILHRIHSKLDEENINGNRALINLIEKLEENFKKFVKNDPCGLCPSCDVPINTKPENHLYGCEYGQ